MNNENLVWLVQTYVTRQLLHILCQMTCSLHAHELLSNYYVMMLWCLFKSQSLLCLDVDDSPKIFMKVSEMILLPPLFSPCERFYLGTHACTHMPRQDIEVSFSFFFLQLQRFTGRWSSRQHTIRLSKQYSILLCVLLS